MKILYQVIKTQVDEYLPLDWHFELRTRLFLLLTGMVLAQSCSPSRIAKALYQFGYTTAQEASIERRMRRIENDKRLSAEACLHPFARHHLRIGKPKELVLIIDATTHTDKTVMLMVSVRYRGRSLPLAWDAPNWKDQFRQHHLYAFVMGTLSSIVKVRLYLYSTVRP